MKNLGNFTKWYLYITTSILAVCAVSFSMAERETIAVRTLWQILLSGFFTTVVTFFMLLRESNQRSLSMINYFFHYIFLCLIMILCGKWFGWIDYSLSEMAMMSGAVAVVYLLSFGAYYLIDLKQANEINRKLQEKYSSDAN